MDGGCPDFKAQTNRKTYFLISRNKILLFKKKKKIKKSYLLYLKVYRKGIFQIIFILF